MRGALPLLLATLVLLCAPAAEAQVVGCQTYATEERVECGSCPSGSVLIERQSRICFFFFRDVLCLFTDFSTCLQCQPGYTLNADGTCDICAAGTSDTDSVSSSPCSPCSAAGLFVPAGSSGLCSQAAFRCPAGTSDLDGSSATECSSCPGGTAVTTTGFSAPCPPCEVGTTDHDNDPATACQDCLPGSFQAAGQTGACASCLDARTDDDASPRTPCIECQPGTQAPASHVGPCERCLAGTTDHDSSAATLCRACAAGTEVSVDGAIGPCPECAAGTIDEDNNPATPCTICASPGSYVPAGRSGPCSERRCNAGLIDHDRNALTICQPCPAGTSIKFRGTAAPVAGLTLAQACEAHLCPIGTHDHDFNPATECVSCELGLSFNTAKGQTECTPTTACVEGEFQTLAPTLSSDRQCRTVTICQPGEIEVKAPTPTSDRLCVPSGTLPVDCQGGSYASLVGQLAWVQNGTNSSRQLLCDRGFVVATRFFQPASAQPLTPAQAARFAGSRMWIEGESTTEPTSTGLGARLLPAPSTSATTPTVESEDWRKLLGDIGHPHLLRQVIKVAGTVVSDLAFEFESSGLVTNASLLLYSPAIRVAPPGLTLLPDLARLWLPFRLDSGSQPSATTIDFPPCAVDATAAARCNLTAQPTPAAGSAGLTTASSPFQPITNTALLAPSFPSLASTTNGDIIFSPSLPGVLGSGTGPLRNNSVELLYLLRRVAHTPPQVTQNFVLARVPVTAASGTIVLAVSATTQPQYTLSYMLTPQGARAERAAQLFTIDPTSGIISTRAAFGDTDIGAFSFEIVISDSRAVCVTDKSDGSFDAKSGPCSTVVQAEIVVRLEYFDTCPELVEAVSSDGTPVAVTFREPTPNPSFGITLTPSHRSGDVFPLGRTTVGYVGVTDEGVGVNCTFSVTVFRGGEVVVGQVGVLSTDAAAVASSGVSKVEFLLDGTGVQNSVSPPALTTDLTIPNVDLVLILRASGGAPFRLPSTSGCRPILDINLLWCTSGFWQAADTATAVNGSARLALQDLRYKNLDTLPFSFTYASATADGRCFRIAGQSEGLDANLFFQALRVELSLPPALPFAGGNRVYQPSRSSAVRVLFPSSAPCLLQAHAQTLIIKDTQPPRFVGCPADMQVNVSLANATTSGGAQVFWREIGVTDDIGLLSQTQSAVPGDLFLLRDSPIQVVYEAVDTSNNVGRCTWTIELFYDAVVAGSSSVVERSMFVREDELESLVVVDAIPLAASLPTVGIAVDATSLRLSFRLPVGEQFDVIVGAGTLVPSTLLQVRLAMREQSVADTTLLSGLQLLGMGDEYVRVELVGARRLADSQPYTVSKGWFVPVVSTVVSEDLIVLSGSAGAPITEAITFDEIRIDVFFPKGRAFNASSSALSSGRKRRAAETGTSQFVVEPGDSQVAFVSSTSVVPVPDVLVARDIQAPEWVTCPADRVVSAELNQNFALVSWEAPIFTDNRPQDVTVTFTRDAGTPFLINKVGEHTQVVYTAEDGDGNTAVCRFDVTVRDEQAPMIVCPANVSAALAVDDPAVQTVTLTTAAVAVVSLSDNSGAVNATVAGREYGVGVTDVALTATDGWGNTATCVFSVEVRDPFPPKFTRCPPNQRLEAEQSGSREFTWSEPVAVDNVDGAAVSVSAPNIASGTRLSEGNYTVVYYATDRAGNEVNCTFRITVLPPVFGAGTGAASSGGGSAAMAGGAAGGVALLLLVGLVVMRRRHKRAIGPKEHDFAVYLDQLEKVISDGRGAIMPREIPRKKLTLLDELGQGQFGLVLKGLMTENAAIPPYLVAIKSLKDNALPGERDELLQEAGLMAQFIHPHVVRLVGVVTLGDPVLVVVEYAEHGSLKTYLEKNDLSLEEQYLLAGDCASGLAHITSRGFLHRDVAARNVLISSQKRAKISDFGLSRDVGETETYYRSSKNGALPIRWSAPEALEERKFSVATDVWSYGVVLYEIWTKAALPYRGWGNQRVWVEVVGGHRLSCPNGCPKAVHDMMLRCWDADSHQRPGFVELKAFFRNLFRPEDEGEYDDQPPENFNTTILRSSRGSLKMAVGSELGGEGSDEKMAGSDFYDMRTTVGLANVEEVDEEEEEGGNLYEMGDNNAIYGGEEEEEEEEDGGEDGAGDLYDMGENDNLYGKEDEEETLAASTRLAQERLVLAAGGRFRGSVMGGSMMGGSKGKLFQGTGREQDVGPFGSTLAQRLSRMSSSGDFGFGPEINANGDSYLDVEPDVVDSKGKVQPPGTAVYEMPVVGAVYEVAASGGPGLDKSYSAGSTSIGSNLPAVYEQPVPVPLSMLARTAGENGRVPSVRSAWSEASMRSSAGGSTGGAVYDVAAGGGPGGNYDHEQPPPYRRLPLSDEDERFGFL